MYTSLVVVGNKVGGHGVVVVEVVRVMTVRVVLYQIVSENTIAHKAHCLHWMPNHTSSEVVFAVLSSLDNARETAITPDSAVAVVLKALLSGVQDGCQGRGKVEEGSEGRELHLDLGTDAGLLGLMCVNTQLWAVGQTLYASRNLDRLVLAMLGDALASSLKTSLRCLPDTS